MEREERSRRLEEFRENINIMTNGELIALLMLIRRSEIVFGDELAVLREAIRERLSSRTRLSERLFRRLD